jgi:hypothetical protein
MAPRRVSLPATYPRWIGSGVEALPGLNRTVSARLMEAEVGAAKGDEGR